MYVWSGLRRNNNLKAIDFNSSIIAAVRRSHKERVITAFLQLHYQVYETTNTTLHALHNKRSKPLKTMNLFKIKNALILNSKQNKIYKRHGGL